MKWGAGPFWRKRCVVIVHHWFGMNETLLSDVAFTFPFVQWERTLTDMLTKLKSIILATGAAHFATWPVFGCVCWLRVPVVRISFNKTITTLKIVNVKMSFIAYRRLKSQIWSLCIAKSRNVVTLCRRDIVTSDTSGLYDYPFILVCDQILTLCKSILTTIFKFLSP